MFILSIDPAGLSLDWCLRCSAAGHTVKLYTKGSRASHIGEGLVDKVDNWKKYMDVADLIFVSDNMSFMEELDEYHKKGYPIYGPGKRAAKLELDRMYGQEVIEEFKGEAETIVGKAQATFDELKGLWQWVQTLWAQVAGLFGIAKDQHPTIQTNRAEEKTIQAKPMAKKANRKSAPKELTYEEYKYLGHSDDLIELIHDIAPENVQFFMAEYFLHFAEISFACPRRTKKLEQLTSFLRKVIQAEKIA